MGQSSPLVARILKLWCLSSVSRTRQSRFALTLLFFSILVKIDAILQQSHQSQFTLATYKNLHFSAQNDSFCLEMDATRCLKAKIAKIVFALTIFGDFCTILHESHQSQFTLATYKNLHFSAQNDSFWLDMDAARCLKAKIAKIVFTLTIFVDFCTILHESHQSQFTLATYKNLHFSAQNDSFCYKWMQPDA